MFAVGIATDCANLDPASLVPALPALRAQKACTGARWRRTGGHVELQIANGDAWTRKRIYEQPPAPRGFRMDFDGSTVGGAGFGSDAGGMGATHVLTGKGTQYWIRDGS